MSEHSEAAPLWKYNTLLRTARCYPLFGPDAICRIRASGLCAFLTRMRSMKQLSDHLFWVKDTCSVYGISADGGTLLIDCGTHFLSDNESLARLPRVERVLLTHFHRDQCATAASWARHGARVVMPFAEQRHLQEADLQRAAYDIHDNYDSYYPCFSPLDDLSSSDAAVDYETLNWRDHAFRVIPLPGHTFGSVGYVFEIDGQRILACGDLLASAGTIRDYFWTSGATWISGPPQPAREPGDGLQTRSRPHPARSRTSVQTGQSGPGAVALAADRDLGALSRYLL